MSQLEASLPRKLARRIAGRCCYGACPDPAIDGSDYCAPHDAHERGRDAAKKRRRRLHRSQLGLCADGCGRKVGKRRTKHGHVTLVRCIECANAHRDRQRERCVPDESAGVPDGEPRTKLEVHKDGYVRERYIGRGVRGQKPRAALDADLRRQAREIAEHVTHFAERGLTTLREIEASRPTHSQRQEARLLATDPLERSMRIAVGLIVAIRPGGRRAIEEWYALWKLGDEYGADGDE